MGDVLDEIMDGQDPEPEVEEEQQPEETQQDTGEIVESETPSPSLEERLAALEKENKGLQSAVSAEREKRHRFEGSYKQLSDIVASTISKRDVEQKPAEPEPEKKIELSYDDDGNPFLPASVLKKLTAAETNALKEELLSVKRQLENERAQRSRKDDVQRQVSDVIGDNEDFKEAYGIIKESLDWVVPKIGDHLVKSGINLGKAPRIEHILEAIDGSDIEESFSKRFGVDIEHVLRAHSTKRDMRKALKSVASLKKKTDTADDTLDKIVNRPAGLSGARNQKPVEDYGPSLKELAKTAENIEDMSEKEYERFKEQLATLS